MSAPPGLPGGRAGRGGRDGAKVSGLGAFDFSTYDLDALRDDVRSVLDVGGAVGVVARWVGGAAVASMCLSWIVFGPRIESALMTGVFVATATVLAVPTGVALGAWILARRRFATITDASGRVVDMIGEIHRDVVRVRHGGAQTSVRRVAVGIFDEGVLPIVFDTATEAAEGMLGPFGFLVRRVAAAPRALVERSVIAAVKALPDRRIGDLVDHAATAVDDLVSDLGDEYERIRDGLTGIVRRVSRVSLTLGSGAAIVGVVPLLLWWLVGFALT